MQYGILYKVTKNFLNIITKLVIIYKKLLTFPGSYDMLIMLGRLYAGPFRFIFFVV